VLIAAGAIVILGAVILLLPLGGSNSPKDASADKGRYTKTPDACAVLTDTDVAKVLIGASKRPAGGTAVSSVCDWDARGSADQLPSNLEVIIVRYEGAKGTTADQKAHQGFVQQAHPEPPFEGFAGKQESIPGLGDEATLAGSVSKVINHTPVFDYGLWIRRANVVAKVTFHPLIYTRTGHIDEYASSARARSGELDTGTHLAYNLSTM
jgi:hypothetical protein